MSARASSGRQESPGAAAVRRGAVASKRAAGRPAEAVLSKTQITRAALKLIELDGYKGLTMSALAKRLGVAPSALYNHVAAKQDVLMLLEDHLMAMVDVSGFDGGAWEPAVRRWAWSYRDVFARHTPLIPVIAVLPVTNAPQTVAMYEAVTAGFLADGWPRDQIVDAIVVLESFIFGSAFDVTAPLDIFETGGLAESAPGFTAAVAHRWDDGETSRSDAAFQLGLDAMIAGLSALRTRMTSSVRPPIGGGEPFRS